MHLVPTLTGLKIQIKKVCVVKSHIDINFAAPLSTKNNKYR